MKQPSEWLGEILAGRIDLADTPEAIRSWSRLAIYQHARDIVRMGTKEQGRKALDKLPALFRVHVEREAKRLWPMREWKDL